MGNKIKRIGVLTSGGDSQGMNSAIYSVTRYALSQGIEVLGIKDGYKGLIHEDIINLDARSVDNIIHRGGTMLGTARCLEFKTKEGTQQAYDMTQKYGMDGLVVIGGDGSLQGAARLSKLGIKTMGIPGTIDNDLAYTEYTLGFDSAVNTVMSTIKMLRDTMTSNGRTCVVEVMGRNCGDIALYAGITSGAEIILVPEVPYTVDEVVAKLQHNISHGKVDNIVVLAEGAGSASKLVSEIKERMTINIRSMVVGHLQRGGDATFADRQLGVRMGRNAVKRLQEGFSNRVLGVVNGKIINVDISEAVEQHKQFDMGIYELANQLVDSF